MDNFSFVPPGPIRHNVEIYTARFFVQGIISGPYQRVSDLLNRKDNRFLTVEDAAISPVGQEAQPQKVNYPLSLAHAAIHFVALIRQSSGLGDDQPAQGLLREYHIAKNTHPCYALTDSFIICGRCHLRENTSLNQLLEIGDPFIPITETTLFLAARPSASWQRDVLIVNKEKVEAMYLAGAK